MPKTTTQRPKSKPVSSRTVKKTPSRQKPVSRAKSYQPARKSSRSKAAPAWDGLTREQKLDFIGAFIAMLGLISFLTLFSSDATVAVWWSGLWFKLVGGGAYYFSLAFVFLGMWLLLSRSERVPPLTFGRLAGIALLMLNVLLWISLVVSGLPSEAVSTSGGILGFFLRQLFVNSLGMAATVVVLIAWLLIGITLAFDLSLTDLYHGARPVLHKLRLLVDEIIRRWQQENMETRAEVKMIPPDAPVDLPESFQPLQDLSQTRASQPAALKSRTVEKSSPDAVRPLREKPATPGETPTQPVGQPTVVRSRPAAVWKLPALKDILDPATPAAQQESSDMEIARLLEDT
ncbi:MAG: DNA translocase FtsK 4TM domain-containing protein, partial [Anaerolineaceae bacterium]